VISLAKGLLTVFRKLVKDRRGHHIIEEGLLLGISIALFILLILKPVEGLMSWFQGLVTSIQGGAESLKEQIINGLKNLWQALWSSGL